MMNLADKPCYPSTRQGTIFSKEGRAKEEITLINDGLTFRERLIIALAGNPNACYFKKEAIGNFEGNAELIISQADAIIKELEEGTK